MLTSDSGGYFTVSIGSSVTETKIDYKRTTILKVIGSVGASALSIVALIRLCLNHYQTFNYYMDALKSLYFERRDAEGNN